MSLPVPINTSPKISARLLLRPSVSFHFLSALRLFIWIAISSMSVSSIAFAATYYVAQTTYVPMSEPDVVTALKAIAGATKVSGTIETTIAISGTAAGTSVVYDHWEDGYEADIKNPVQATTEIFTLNAGQTQVLRSSVNPSTPLVIDYDGRDKIGATYAVSVTKAGWSSTPGTVLAGAVSVIDSGNAGLSYSLPIGQNVDTVATGTNKLFEYTSAHISSTQNGTTVTIDLDGNPLTANTTVSLNEGETYFVNGGLNSGAKISADKGIGVYLIAGDVGAAYENRWFGLIPDAQWDTSYFAPVSTTLTTDPAYVILYNPNGTTLSVQYETATTTGMISVPATGSRTNYFLMPASAAHFYTTNGSKFYAISVIDADATDNATHDWSYSLVPENYLTDKFVVAWGPGNGNLPPSTSTNGSPVWVTTKANTFLYIDSAAVTVKDGSGAAVTRTLVSGSTYKYPVSKLKSYRVSDSDNDQSGLTAYTTDGTQITAAWGEDPSVAAAGTPYLDMGTTVLPYPDYSLTKVSAEAATAVYGPTVSDNDTQIELGEQILYTVTVTNRAVIDLFNINVKDAIRPTDGATYVLGSTTIKVLRADGTVLTSSALPDKVVNDPFPLSKLDGGYTLTDVDPGTLPVNGLHRGEKIIFTYRAQVRANVNPALASAGFIINNDAEMAGIPAGSITPIPTKLTTLPTFVSVNGTADGQAFIKDSSYAGVITTFTENTTLGIQVTDADANITAGVDTLTVTVTNITTGEIETLILTETGGATGVFRNPLATSSTTGASNNDGTLKVHAADQIKVDYTDPLYGIAFDNPAHPGVAGDADGNIDTGNANTATASVTVPTLTKTLYLSDDSPNNLDRVMPPAGDVTATSTALINATAASTGVHVTDDFITGTYTGGTGGWTSNWTEIGESDGTGNGQVRMSSGFLYMRNTTSGNGISRSFPILPAAGNLSFEIRDRDTTNQYEDADSIEIQQNVGGVWTSVGTLTGLDISTTFSIKSFTLSQNAIGIRILPNAGSSDRVYIDNLELISGYATTANATGTTDYPVGTSTPAGQTFSFTNSGSVADSISVNQLVLSLKKSGTTSATATVSVRSIWDGTALWSGTVTTAQLTTSYQNFTFTATDLSLNRTATYYIRVDSSNNGIVWQGNTASSYADGTRIGSTGSAATGDMRFTVNGSNEQVSSLSFTQSLSMATDLVLPAGGVLKVVTHVTNTTGLASSQAHTATLSAGGTTFATATNPVYNSGAGTLTWTFAALGSTKTITAGQSAKMVISNAQSGVSYKIAYDSAATRSRIELPTNTVISLTDADSVTVGLQEIGLFSQSFANGGSPITAGFIGAGGIVYIRCKVVDPFGDYDISSLQLDVDDGAGGATPISIALSDTYMVDSAADGRAYKTYEYAWQTTYNIGTYSIAVVANEGAEGTITDSANTTFVVNELDLGTPSITQFLTNLSTAGGIEAGALYPTGSNAYLRVIDLDEAGNGTVIAVINGYTVTLTETSTPGIFEADLSNPAVHVSNTNADASPASYFTSMPGGRFLAASYVDQNDDADTSSDTIGVNAAPVAINNARTIGMDQQAVGNAVADNNGAGVDSDTNGQGLIVTAVNGSAANLNDTITLPSGARLFVSSNGSYIYDPSSLTTPPSPGTPTVSDSFSYTVSDGFGGTSTATVSLTVTYVDSAVIDNQADTDGKVIELDVSNKFAVITALTEVTYSSTGLPTGLTIDPITGIISGTIGSGASGVTGSNTFNVSITATDVNGVEPAVVRNFTWSVTNVVPTAENNAYAVPNTVVLSGNLITDDGNGAVLGGVDADGTPDTDTLILSQINGSSFTLNASIVLTNGTLKITNTNGAFTYTPNVGSTDGDTFTYTISDGNGGTAIATATITRISVNNLTVNEASPFAVFSAGGAEGQQVQLSLSNTAVGTDVDAILGTDSGASLEYFNGTNWVAYTPGSFVTIPSDGDATPAEFTTMLVRVVIYNDTPAVYEGAENFTLIVTPDSGVGVTGICTILDDGTGSVYPDNTTGSDDPAAIKDDDHPMVVSNVTVNEASPYAVFTVAGVAAQKAVLSIVNNVDGSDLTDLEYFDSTLPIPAWVAYTGGTQVTLPAGGSLLVRVAISPEQETAVDCPETYTLIATTITGTASPGGLGTINDDGTGSIFLATNNTATPNISGDPGYPALDDDRPMAVTNVTVNEGSPYAVFTVSGIEGQKAIFSITNTTTTGLTGIQYFNGSSWVSYSSGTVTPPTVGGTLNGEASSLLVRVAIAPEQETALDTGETFKLMAATTSGTVSTGGKGTINDDGTGSIFLVTNNTATPNVSGDPGYPVTLDDDRVMAVTNVTVNEASPYAVFTLTGAASQKALLSITNTTTTGLTGIEYFDSSLPTPAWVTYTGGSFVTLPAGGSLLVRVAISPEQETTLDTGETFKLVATTTGGTVSTGGTGTINDDGTGSIFLATNNTATPNVSGDPGYPVTLDDDRVMAVTNVTVNEGSPYAVFTVTGAASQKALLSITNITTTGLATIQYFDGAAWQPYTGGNYVPLLGGGSLLVRVAILPEQETALDTGETFKLVATSTGGTASTGGTGSIYDDGTGSIFLATNNTATPNSISDPGYPATLDDDRAKITIKAPNNTVLIDGVSTVNIGSASTCYTSTGTFTLRNDGAANLNITSISIDGTDTSHFAITTTLVYPLIILPGAQTTLDVKFSATAEGLYTAFLHVLSNDGNTPSFDVALTGTGVNVFFSGTSPVTTPGSTIMTISASDYVATDHFFTPVLGYPPSPGDEITAIDMVGHSIIGNFYELPEKGVVALGYQGVIYYFTATYTGGADGKDLVLTNFMPDQPAWTWLAGPKKRNNLGKFAGTPLNPGARQGAAHFKRPNGDLWSFGGYGYGATSMSKPWYLNDLWEFSKSAGTWRHVKGSETVNETGVYGVKGTPGALNTPGSRHSSSAWVACDHHFWVFGGFGPLGRHNDLWTFNPDTEEWTWKHGSNLVGQAGVYGTKGVSAPANTPGARQGGVCWAEGCEIWLFGGTTDGGTTFHNDLWRYSIYGGEWTWMGGPNTTSAVNLTAALGTYGTKGTGSVNNIPGARRDAVGWVTTNKLWLFGGHGFPGSGTVEGDLNDLWYYEVSTGKWTWVNGSNNLDSPGGYSAGSTSTPGARSASSGWTTADGKLWLCGGLIGSTANLVTYGPQMNDIWTYDPSANQWSYQSGSQTGGTIGLYGTIGVKSPSNHPSGRWTMGTITTLNGDQWFFGGGGLDGFGIYGRHSDLWNYGITMPLGTPPAPPSTPFPDSLIINTAPTATNAAAATMASVPVNGQVTGKDADGDIILFNTTGTTLSQGTLTLQSNGQWTYVPAPGFVGTDTFTFKASDYYGGQSPTRTLTITVTTNPADADNDGIPDNYEQSTFGSTGTDALGDADGDGQSNYFEYLAGTSPVNAGQSLTTAPTIAAGAGSNGGSFKLDLSHVRPGVSYHLETSSDMDVWNRIGTFTFSVSGSAAIEDPTAPTGQPAFYRVSLEAASGLLP